MIMIIIIFYYYYYYYKISIEDTIYASTRVLKYFIEKGKEKLTTAAQNSTDNINIKRFTITLKQKCRGKQLYGHFKQQTNNISHEKTWTWLRKGNFLRETESLPIAA